MSGFPRQHRLADPAQLGEFQTVGKGGAGHRVRHAENRGIVDVVPPVFRRKRRSFGFRRFQPVVFGFRRHFAGKDRKAAEAGEQELLAVTVSVGVLDHPAEPGE